MLKARVITALVLVCGLLAVLFVLPAAQARLVFALVTALAAWEWAGLMKASSVVRIAYGAAMFLTCLGVERTGLHSGLWPLAVLFWLIGAPLWLRYRWSLSGLSGLGYGIGVLVLLPAWAAMGELLGRGPWWLIGVIALVAVADIGAYFAGRAFGKHKLAPMVSPGKTWEGVAGGMFAATVYVLSAGSALQANWPILVIAGCLLVAFSIVGDLFESLLKRQAGLKDSSQLLPGHGGVLDRVDSLTAALPLSVVLMRWSGL